MNVRIFFLTSVAFIALSGCGTNTIPITPSNNDTATDILPTEHLYESPRYSFAVAFPPSWDAVERIDDFAGFNPGDEPFSYDIPGFAHTFILDNVPYFVIMAIKNEDTHSKTIPADQIYIGTQQEWELYASIVQETGTNDFLFEKETYDTTRAEEIPGILQTFKLH